MSVFTSQQFAFIHSQQSIVIHIYACFLICENNTLFKIVSQRGLFLGLLVLTILKLLTRWPVVSVLMEQKVDETLHNLMRL